MDGAIDHLERARDLDPEKGSIRETLGLAYLRASRLVDAEAEVTVAIDLAPNDAYCYYLLGRAQQGLGFMGWPAARTRWLTGSARAPTSTAAP